VWSNNYHVKRSCRYFRVSEAELVAIKPCFNALPYIDTFS
jgi:hypothetical protein